MQRFKDAHTHNCCMYIYIYNRKRVQPISNRFTKQKVSACMQLAFFQTIGEHFTLLFTTQKIIFAKYCHDK